MSTNDQTRLSLHDYMKSLENPTKMILDSDYFIIRADGRSFGNYCREFEFPYDEGFMSSMDQVAVALCKEISGAIAAYIQSDEISVLIKNPKTKKGTTSAWFGGEVVKMTTAVAAVASVSLSRIYDTYRPAYFDARVFSVEENDIARYFFWRQRDAIKNSTSMCAEAVFSNKELRGKSTDARRKMLQEQNAPWEDAPKGFQQGRLVIPVKRSGVISYQDKRSGEWNVIERDYLSWESDPAPLFTPDGSDDLFSFLEDKRTL